MRDPQQREVEMRKRVGYSTVVLLLMLSSIAAGQIGRGRRQASADPGYWVGLSYGYVDGTTIDDDATKTEWQFGYTSQLRATVEKTLQRGVSIGASAGFATAPLTYSGLTLGATCSGSCLARADITQWLAFLHVGAGPGFHGVYSVEAGVTQFSNFRERDSETKLPPSSASSDFTFGFGGGFGYGFSSMADAYVGEQFQFVLHPQGDNPHTNAPRFLTFRVGFRMGF